MNNYHKQTDNTANQPNATPHSCRLQTIKKAGRNYITLTLSLRTALIRLREANYYLGITGGREQGGSFYRQVRDAMSGATTIKTRYGHGFRHQI